MVSRRSFLRGAAVAGGAILLPSLPVSAAKPKSLVKPDQRFSMDDASCMIAWIVNDRSAIRQVFMVDDLGGIPPVYSIDSKVPCYIYNPYPSEKGKKFGRFLEMHQGYEDVDLNVGRHIVTPPLLADGILTKTDIQSLAHSVVEFENGILVDLLEASQLTQKYYPTNMGLDPFHYDSFSRDGHPSSVVANKAGMQELQKFLEGSELQLKMFGERDRKFHHPFVGNIEERGTNRSLAQLYEINSNLLNNVVYITSPCDQVGVVAIVKNFFYDRKNGEIVHYTGFGLFNPLNVTANHF